MPRQTPDRKGSLEKLFVSRREIPSHLTEAKRSAIAEFLKHEEAPTTLAFAARIEPRHNVVGIGLGHKISKGKTTGQPCVRFYVERKLPKSLLSKEVLLPEKIGQVLTDVIETGRFAAFATSHPERSHMRPARPGCSVGFELAGALMAGTFGAVVELNGKHFILSNNHVLANQNKLPKGSPIFQPGLLDSNGKKNQIAELSEFVTLQAGTPNSVDCAIAEVSSNGQVSPTVLPKVNKLKSGQPVSAAEHMIVEKTGRTTGYTTGVIQDISATVKVGYDLGPLTFEDQIIIVGSRSKSFSDAGDSGSLIVEKSSKRPVGLLFGGSPTHTIANHIDDVIKELKVTIVA